jgi:hypothetical protein
MITHFLIFSDVFVRQTWHSVRLSFGGCEDVNGCSSGWQAVALDGKVLANSSAVLFDSWRIAMGLNRYMFASVDNFAITYLR